jgi:hypothetical protein
MIFLYKIFLKVNVSEFSTLFFVPIQSQYVDNHLATLDIRESNFERRTPNSINQTKNNISGLCLKISKLTAS